MDINDDNTPYFTKRQAFNMLTKSKERLDELTKRTTLLPQAIDVLMNEDLNPKQKKRLSDFIAEPASYGEFAKVAMFLEDFDDPPADEADEKAPAAGSTPAAGAAGAAGTVPAKKEEKAAEPDAKRRRLHNSAQAASMMRQPADTKKDVKKSSSAPPVPDAFKSLMEVFGMSEDVLNSRVSDGNFDDRLADVLGGIKNEKPVAGKVA